MDGKPIPEQHDPATIITGWHQRPAQHRDSTLNALTVDVEDWFQVEAFFGVINRESWSRRECRVEGNVMRILELFARHNVRGTFFTLAWVAERYPALVRRIVDAGHELASHGTDHRRADSQSPGAFAADVLYAKVVLEDIGGRAVKGYRAPSFSVLRSNLWTLEALAEAGYRYSSSTYPIAHDNYGIPEAPRFAFYPSPTCGFLEIPVTSLRWLSRNWPCGGGGYFRLLPYALNKRALETVRRNDGKPLVFYFHPWEIDPGQPRVEAASFKSRLRHYTNIDRMEDKLARLLRAFRWGRMDEIFLPEGAS